jgi:hypothetical protein
MTPKDIIVRRMRLILDGLLVLALILAITLSSYPTKANAELQTPASNTQPVSTQALHSQDTLVEPLAGSNPLTDGVTIDNNTLAAIIAAQNAALTPPQYMIGLPIIQR